MTPWWEWVIFLTVSAAATLAAISARRDRRKLEAAAEQIAVAVERQIVAAVLRRMRAPAKPRQPPDAEVNHVARAIAEEDHAPASLYHGCLANAAIIALDQYRAAHSANTTEDAR